MSRHTRTQAARLMAICLVSGLSLLAACASSSTPTASSGAVPTTTGSGASSSGPSATAAPGSAPSSSTVSKVSANTATQEQLVAAFTAAGIPNASKWAHEVEEYRPYPADDPSLAKLKKELQKYNPSPEVLAKILATLQP